MDGTVFGLINRGVPFEPLLGGPGTRFDALKFKYVGSPALDTPVLLVRSLREGGGPDPHLWADIRPVGGAVRARNGVTAEEYRFYLARRRPASGVAAVMLPPGRSGRLVSPR